MKDYITIDNRKRKSKKRQRDKVIHITKLVEKNKYLLICISKVYINKALIEDDEFNMENETDKALKNLVLSGKINEVEAGDFKKIWIKMNGDDIGEFLENIVSLYGPYKCNFQKSDFSVESKVYETDKNNNFDVIFYNSECNNGCDKKPRIRVFGELEFHECKKNVCNFIPYDTENEMKEDDEKKLAFMFEVNNMVQNCKFFIPTFAYNVSGSQKFLNSKNYDFVQILGIKQLMDVFTR